MLLAHADSDEAPRYWGARITPGRASVSQYADAVERLPYAVLSERLALRAWRGVVSQDDGLGERRARWSPGIPTFARASKLRTLSSEPADDAEPVVLSELRS
jgi:hypothetical protein